jgi:hypothetical protein
VSRTPGPFVAFEMVAVRIAFHESTIKPSVCVGVLRLPQDPQIRILWTSVPRVASSLKLACVGVLRLPQALEMQMLVDLGDTRSVWIGKSCWLEQFSALGWSAGPRDSIEQGLWLWVCNSTASLSGHHLGIGILPGIDVPKSVILSGGLRSDSIR